MDGLKAIMELAKLGNQYINEKEPWKNEKEKPTVIYVCTNLVKAISVFLWPFLPETAENIQKQLGISKKLDWSSATELLKAGHKIGEPKPLIQKVEIKP